MESRSALQEIYRRPSAMAKYRLPLFEPYWERYLLKLCGAGYSRWHLFKVVQSLTHFHEFLSRRGLHLKQVAPQHLEDFLGQKRRRSQRRGQLLKRRSFQNTRPHIGAFLRDAVAWKPPERPPEPDSRVLPAKLLASYSRFCLSHRGLNPSTLKNNMTRLSEFGLFLDQAGLEDIRNLSVRNLDAFLSAIAGRMKPASLRGFVTSLRSLLRYLQLQGILSMDLARLVISPMRFHRDRRPKYLPWRKVQQLLASIDRSVLAGKRDYAILTLMACHGLRNGEVGALRLENIDWEKGSLLLRERKGGDTQALPISSSTLQALRDYVAVRPAVSDPQVFLTVAAPLRPVGSNAEARVGWHLHRCFGNTLPHYGAHILRHSFAKALLDQGAKITDVKELLGHHHLESTHVYTHIATNDLREVADNYASFLVTHEENPL